jgi:pSer/pThr/pTyr-binding forkhead associated (FHA) protein
VPKVVITEGPDAGNEFELEHAVILGRLDSNDIPIRDKKASREHAKIYRQGQQYAIVDLNSSNGTFVNEEQVTKRILEPGDEIGIGMVRMRFDDPEAEAAEKAKSEGQMSLDDALSTSSTGPKKEEPGKTPEIVLKSYQPIQYSRVKPGNPILGFDFDQLSETGRILIWIGLIVVFGALIYLGYSVIAP